ncbi:biotin-dependent carboxyltransferase family protein [Rhodomicrobium sp. Az07]|uniref:5-oxoprolinase subunit C family protein n=1 Tax=Rhodomicrobium sp. Az07 TaxID=2839034 RepID=UPI001BE8EDB4|nr:biotin-dependent carboxyltransferase family protein [Rhodomicrobium sp. Az07]
MRPALTIVEPGFAATIQDRGREGWQRFGVPVSGALDPEALAAANILAGNAPDSAAIEVMGAGLRLRVDAESVTLAVAGCAAPVRIERERAPSSAEPLRSFMAHRGEVLRFPPPKNGAVYYIAAAGGFAISAVLGSRSTYTRARLGGIEGRVLRAGDAIALMRGTAPGAPPLLLDARFDAPEKLRVMRGPNADYFTERAFDSLLGAAYTVAPASDRMGLRLEGTALDRAKPGEVSPQGTTAGALQVPPDGQPILLLPDRQTTGGYPRIATVIGADIAAAGRLAAGMAVRFAEVGREEAVAVLKARAEWLAALASCLRPAPDHAITAERLLGENLIGGVTSGEI